MFPSMVEVVPEGKRGVAEITHFEVSKEDSMFTALRSIVTRRNEVVQPGRYAKLCVNGSLMMTDTRMEQYSNYEVVRRSHGRVLIAGLGLGMILTRILPKQEVKSVLVVEKYQDVIDLVSPHVKSPKLSVVCADIFEWKPAKDERFDVIYFDIWPDRSDDNIQEMTRLHRRFCRCLNRANPECWMDSWYRRSLLLERRRSSRW